MIRWLDTLLCGLGLHVWCRFASTTAAFRRCARCPKRQFWFSGAWKDVPQDVE